jgi:hypothetical protein
MNRILWAVLPLSLAMLVACSRVDAAAPSCPLPPGITVGAEITLLMSMGPQPVKVLTIDPASCWVQVQWEQANIGFTKSTRTMETYWINPQGLLGISTERGRRFRKGRGASNKTAEHINDPVMPGSCPENGQLPIPKGPWRAPGSPQHTWPTPPLPQWGV